MPRIQRMSAAHSRSASKFNVKLTDDFISHTFLVNTIVMAAPRLLFLCPFTTPPSDVTARGSYRNNEKLLYGKYILLIHPTRGKYKKLQLVMSG